MELYISIIESVPLFLFIIVFYYIANYMFMLVYDFDDAHELTVNDNSAYGIVTGGLMIALSIALAGSFYGATDIIGGDFIHIVSYSTIAVVLLLISITINDKFILNEFSIYDEIARDKNIGTAFVVAGSLVATSLVMYGAFHGTSVSMFRGYVDFVFYWFVGQVILIIGSLLFKRIVKYDLHSELEHNDNPAAGLSFGGFLVGLGILVMTSIYGATGNILAELPLIVFVFVIGMPLLVIVSKIMDMVFISWRSIDEEILEKNIAIGTVSAFSYITISWLLFNVITSI